MLRQSVPKKSTAVQRGNSGRSKAAASPMPLRSAPRLNVLARSSRTTVPCSSQGGAWRRRTPAIPWPVTRPIRAEIICTATISG